jgi:hypothetical protein
LNLIIKYIKNIWFWLVIQSLLSFPQNLSVRAVILHEVPQWTWNVFVFYWLTFKMHLKNTFAPRSEIFSFSRDFCLDLLQSKKYIFSKHFRRLVNKRWKHVMCIVVLHVTLQPKPTNSVEMRANFVWQIKIINYFNVFL